MPSRDYYEELWGAVGQDAEPQHLTTRLRFLIDRTQPGELVLDVGCGDGRFAAALAERGVGVLAADVAQEPLRRALARNAALQTLLLDPDGSWPLADASFDVVWAGEVIEHVADTARWLSEVRRVLRSGGRLLLSTPSLSRAALLASALSGSTFAARFEPRSDHLRFYNAATLTELLASFSFQEIRVRTYGPVSSSRRWLLASAVRSRY
jgi:2-polyprenyl-3-methyl-5-hydroxy-6-metoxy-1,4-benzoquinol methylase